MSYRPAVDPANRSFLFGTLIGGGALIASVAVAVFLRSPAPTPEPRLVVVPAPPVVVPITIAAPEPEPIVSPAVPERRIRATSPFLQAECIAGNGENDETCDWDMGLPAISADGKTVVIVFTEHDGIRSNPNMTLRFVDVATSKLVRSVQLLSANEYDGTNFTHLPKLTRRIAAVSSRIAGYRSLIELDNLAHQLEEDEATRLRTDVDLDVARLRVVDTQTNEAIFHGDFSADAIYPNHVDGDRDCTSLYAVGTLPVWWDEPTRTLVTIMDYSHGGVACGMQTDTFVRRLR